MTLTVNMFLIVCPLAFLAGFLDSIAGGGGMITLPAYYLAGLPPALAAGTNKMSASMGTVIATFNYARAGKISYRIGTPAVIGALGGGGLRHVGRACAHGFAARCGACFGVVLHSRCGGIYPAQTKTAAAPDNW